MSNIDYKSKYLKYKNKYEVLKSQTGGQPKNVNTLDDFKVEGRLGNINKTDRDKVVVLLLLRTYTLRRSEKLKKQDS